MLPAELRKQDGIEPGEKFTIERVARGEYRLVRRSATTNESAVE